MAFNDYHIVTRWRLRASLDELAHLFEDVEALARWWPAAFLHVQTVAPGDEGVLGKVVHLQTKGWLPYTLRFHFRVAEFEIKRRFVVVVWGDFEGRCIGTVEARGAHLRVTFDWKVRVQKPLVRRLSWLFKPVFIANHLWVMARGRESIGLELARRRAARRREALTLPAPPGPTFPYDRLSRRLVTEWIREVQP